MLQKVFSTPIKFGSSDHKDNKHWIKKTLPSVATVGGVRPGQQSLTAEPVHRWQVRSSRICPYLPIRGGIWLPVARWAAIFLKKNCWQLPRTRSDQEWPDLAIPMPNPARGQPNLTTPGRISSTVARIATDKRFYFIKKDVGRSDRWWPDLARCGWVRPLPGQIQPPSVGSVCSFFVFIYVVLIIKRLKSKWVQK